MIETTLDELSSEPETFADLADNVEESSFFALMAIDLPSEVQNSLCTPKFVEKVKLYA